MSSGQSQPGAPYHTGPQALHLLAMFVIVHAGQRLVWVAIDVRVRPTYVPVPCPAHVTLEQHKWRKLALLLPMEVLSPSPKHAHQPSSVPQPLPFSF